MRSSAGQVHEQFAMAGPVKTISSPGQDSSSIAVPRRLTDKDVRAIFEALHHGKPVPPHLRFQIVRVGPTGLNLSPPSHEYAGMSI